MTEGMGMRLFYSEKFNSLYLEWKDGCMYLCSEIFKGPDAGEYEWKPTTWDKRDIEMNGFELVGEL